MKKIITIYFLLAFLLVGFVSSIPNITLVTINPEKPTISDDVKICAEVFDESEIRIVRLNLRTEQPVYNWGLIMDKISENKYCKTLSPSVLGAVEGKEFSYIISARNVLGEISIINTSYFKYWEKILPPLPESYCGDGIIQSGEQCDDGKLNGVIPQNITYPFTYCSSECKLMNLIPGGRSGKSEKNYYHFTQFCDVNWKCTSWSNCINGIQTRKCYDANSCGLSYNKPDETAECDVGVLKNPTESKKDFTSLSETSLIVFIGLILISILVIIKKATIR